MKAALVTGATGFIGSRLVNDLLNTGWRVHAVVRRPPGKCLWDAAKVHVHHHDGSTEGLVGIVREAAPDVVFHLASLFLSSHRVEDIVPLIQSNVQFPTQLLEAMHRAGCRRLVNTGTAWQHYENREYSPVNLYAATKQAFETILQYYVEAQFFKSITLTLFDTYGSDDPRLKLVHLLKKAAVSQEKLAMTPGQQLIDLVHIDDVVAAFLLAATRLLDGQVNGNECYGISSGHPISLQELVERYEREANMKLPIEWGGRPYRDREIMTTWNTFQSLPGWMPTMAFPHGLDS